VLFKAIKPFLRANDFFVDINCRYSPMAKEIIENGYRITGFDIHPEPIQYLKNRFPDTSVRLIIE
jgi:2-polyprenyl-3-methyl-5-hydroxy-6-metoxy-1,4-benzoquinol methylase